MNLIATIARPWLVCGVVVLTMSVQQSLYGQARSATQDVGFDQRPGAKLPLDVTLHDEQGNVVQLGGYFGEKPVILTPVYYKCPMLCGLELNGLTRGLRAMEMTVGDEFEVVTFSIDPTETPALAGKKQKQYVAQYGRDAAKQGWHFLTGDPENITRLCDTIGFRAVYDEQTGQYAHAAGIVVCTPQGVISRYLYGVEFAPKDLRLALLESSQEKISRLSDHVLLYCYLYDPTQGKYGLAILNLVRAGGLITVIMIAGGIGLMLRRERINNNDSKNHQTYLEGAQSG